MTKIDEIPVEVTGPDTFSRGNVTPLLHEVRHALEKLVATGESTAIDLFSLPVSPADLELLETILGTGEVNATLEALGPSHVRETAYPGVWWVEHRNSENELVALFIDVVRVPEILAAVPEDLQRSLYALQRALEQQRDS